MEQKGIDLLLKHKYALLGLILALSILFVIFILSYHKTHWALPEKLHSPEQLLNTAEIAFHERFGAPSSRIALADSVILQYRNQDCVMNIFLNNIRSKNNVKKSRHILLLNRNDLKENKKCLNSFVDGL